MFLAIGCSSVATGGGGGALGAEGGVGGGGGLGNSGVGEGTTAPVGDWRQ